MMGSLVGTAYTFHIVSIFSDAGISRSQAVSVFFPASIVAVSLQFSGSWLSDRTKLKYFCTLQAASIVALSLGMVFLAPGVPVVVVIAGQGVMQGLFGITANLTWPRFFGRRHLGAISGFVSALTVAGSAIGPYLFSFARELSGGYAAPALLCAAVTAVLLLASLRADRPAHPAEAASAPGSRVAESSASGSLHDQ